ncbi:CGNR zinc finger domain-containing protein [Rhodococcus marinonascens]|uniref:CGNR zinc finger domain-containing protein n=1 Tax=Rhodococcus marinonascens TaxID=38311 RepID=UPI001FE56B33|nr:ABATE domain-containing protein [Rhodococcus marinonascens]
MQSDLAEMPWIDGDLVLAVANTVVLDFPGDPTSPSLDMLAQEETLATWRRRVPDAAVAELPLGALLELRSAIRAALDAIDRICPVPDDARDQLNTWAAGAPITFTLTATGRLSFVEVADDVIGRLARETLRSFDEKSGDRIVRRCPAPGCGMFFRPGRRDQSWCTVRCGTRARAARHRQQGQRGKEGR